MRDNDITQNTLKSLFRATSQQNIALIKACKQSDPEKFRSLINTKFEGHDLNYVIIQAVMANNAKILNLLLSSYFEETI